MPFATTRQEKVIIALLAVLLVLGLLGQHML
jgi:hypothetical protein